MAMSPLADHREQAARCHLREMGTGGLGGDSSRKGKLAGGQGSAIQKRRQHRGSRSVSDQRGDLGDDGACDHGSYLTPEPVTASANTSTASRGGGRLLPRPRRWSAAARGGVKVVSCAA